MITINMMMNRCIVYPGIGGVDSLQLPMLPPSAPLEYSCQQNMPELSSQASVLSSHHIIMTSIPAAGFISRIVPTFIGVFSYLVSAITNLALPMATQIQNLGETLLTACVLLSVVQASIALYQYRYDAR